MLSNRPFQQGSPQNNAQAHALCSKGLDLVPTSRSILNRMALLSERLDRRDEAVSYWERLLVDLPPYAPAGEVIRTRLQSLR
jgi:hypothetical protein